MTDSTRPLTAAERYYAFLNRVAPINVIITAELDVSLDINLVAETWTEFARLRSLPRLQVGENLTLHDPGAGEVDFVGIESTSDQWNAHLSTEAARHFEFNRPTRCRYLASPAEQRSRVTLIAHHSVTDARIGLGELQKFVRALDGQEIPPQRFLSIALPPARSYPWQDDRERFRALLRDIRARNEQAGPLEPLDWPRPDAPRQPRFFTVALDPPDSADFFASAKRFHSRVYPGIAAAWLAAIAARLFHACEPVLQLATPIDLAVPSVDPDRATSPVIGIIANRFPVPRLPTWDFASQVTEKLDASRANGEGELFFELTRATSVTDLDKGTLAVSLLLASALPAASVTNLGIIDPGSDPEWVRWMVGYVAASPNQIVFVTGTSYRGRLIQTVAVDENQLSVETAQGVIEQFGENVRVMSQA